MLNVAADTVHERIYKSLWHLFIAGVDVYELRRHESKTLKGVQAALIGLHLDCAIADIQDSATALRLVLIGKKRNDPVTESLLHLFIAVVALYEFRTQKSRLGKILHFGVILFHLDAIIAKIAGEKPLSRRILERFVNVRS